MTDARPRRNQHRMRQLGVLLVLTLVVAAAFSSIVAYDGGDDSSMSWMGQDATIHPDLGVVPDS